MKKDRIIDYSNLITRSTRAVEGLGGVSAIPDFLPERANLLSWQDLLKIIPSIDFLNRFGFRVSGNLGNKRLCNESKANNISVAVESSYSCHEYQGHFIGFIPGTIKISTPPAAVPEYGGYMSDEADSYTLYPSHDSERRAVFAMTLSRKAERYMTSKGVVYRHGAPVVCLTEITDTDGPEWFLTLLDRFMLKEV